MRVSAAQFRIYAWFVLAYNVFVVLFGAFVRATGSGAGCGAHWPLCNGVVIPRPERIETIIEFTHRITSGITLIFVLILLILAWKIFTRGSSVRSAVALAVVFTILEALVGAWLVIFQLVDDNDSVHRAVMMMVHLVNTFLLLAALATTAWMASFDYHQKIQFGGMLGLLFSIGLLGILLLGASGAVTALGDTLYPSPSFSDGLREEFSSTAHYLVRMRIYHPGIAIGVGVYLTLITLFIRRKFPLLRVKYLTNILFASFFSQLAIGLINVVLLAPVWMQIIHLFVSTIVWISFVLLFVEIFQCLSLGLVHQKVNQVVDQFSR